MSEFPFLLAGPMIRRASTRNLYIWVATSEPTSITADIYQVLLERDSNNSYKLLPTITDNKTIQTGKHLFIHLIEVTPHSISFPTDILLGYNLHFTTRAQQPFDLGDLGLLDENSPQSIVYENLDYPTLIIQQNSPINIFYGSCQKPHGNDVPAFISADNKIFETSNNIEKRPNALFLMGDQIYADDVADPLFPIISQWSDTLIGEDRNVLLSIDQRLKEVPFINSVDKINGRQYIMEHFGKFTSNQASNHLIRFSEFAAMYLLTFSPSLWNYTNINQNPSFQQLVEKNEYYFVYPNTKEHKKNHKKEYKILQNKYEEQQKQLSGFVQSLAATRRVLANTPTYMIFDDHDITDDWNITAEWQQNVHHSPLGKTVITNGLSAYWLFQGWGNDPDSFSSYDYLAQYHFSYYVTESCFLEEWQDSILDWKLWSFVTPTQPKGLFLDTRTMREYDLEPQPLRIINQVDEGKKAPLLIGKSGWKQIKESLNKSKWKYHDPMIIVSPTPLYGIGVIESFLEKMVYPFRILGIPVDYDLDFEAWKYNGKGFNQFLQQIANWNPSHCILLSGDVHYAGAVQSKVTFHSKQTITLHQYISSPIHNMSFSGLWGKLLKVVVWCKSQIRKRRTIHRSCDVHNRLTTSKRKASKIRDVKWHEEIKYLTSSKGSVIETKNNIGLLTIQQEKMENRLLQNNGTKREVSY